MAHCVRAQALPNDAAHKYRLGATTAVPVFADGRPHTARVTYTAQARAHHAAFLRFRIAFALC
jgi:hypothetical protein